MGRPLPTGTLTFFFSDIEGSTKLVSRLGADFTPLLERHHALLRDAIASRGGTEVRTVGDAFFVVFPTADAAVGAAVDAQRALLREPWPEDAPLRVRMGMHTGTAVLGGDDYVGVDVHLAARISGAGHGGQIVISNATKEQLHDRALTFRDLGEHRLKDVGSIRLWQIGAAELPDAFPPISSLDPVSNLRPELTSFVGREREVAEVSGLIRERRLVTLTGPGGTGKTRLSLKVASDLAAEFKDGVFFVPLATITDAALVPSTIAEALGVPEDPKRAILAVVSERLRDRSTLLVLDNFEQILSAAPIVGDLLGGAKALRCLASSRESLRVYGEQEYPVPVLGLDDAVTLFVQRARAVRPSFTLTDETAATVRAICERLDRLPLAIELAAARAKLFTPEQLLARLQHSLAFLTGGARDRTERQRTLRGAIAWSHDLLTDPERALLRRVSVFSGGIPIDAIGPVCDPDGALGIDPYDAAGSLVDKSLLTRSETGDDEPRVAMLVTIREFGLEQLDAAGETATVRGRHARYFQDLAEASEAEFVGARPAPALDAAEREIDNLRAAMEWSCESGDPEPGSRIGAAIWRFWQQRSHLAEGRAWLERLLALPAAARPTRLRGRALTALGGTTYWQGDFARARAAYEEALRIYESLSDRSDLADALYNLAFIEIIGGAPEKARALLERSLGLYRELSDTTGVTKVSEGLVAVLFKLGDYATALPLQDEVIEAFRASRSVFRLANAQTLQACVALGAGDIPKMRSCLRDALDGMLAADDRSGLIGVLFVYGLLALETGDAERAARLYGAAMKLRGDDVAGATPQEFLGVPNPGDRARAILGDAAYEAAYRSGTRAPFEASVAEARAI